MILKSEAVILIRLPHATGSIYRWWVTSETTVSDTADLSPLLIREAKLISFVLKGYMDDRGDSTDTQYLGDQHVYYDGQPRLVKQWRKKDFASQYFVMSVKQNVGKDGIHWPMILNVPGEGFGDDFLQIYRNQTLLADDDDYLFLLDEALESIGGVCEKMEMAGGGGPPTGQTVHIPSNLEVDENSWFSNVYTYSPVWQAPAKVEEQSMTTGSSGMATTREGDLAVKSCYDESANAVKLEFEFSNADTVGSELPWMAIGYRETAECLMNPRGGGDTEMILITDEEAHFTRLPTMARSFDETAVSSIYEKMTPLEEEDGFSDVSLHMPPAAAAVAKSAGLEDAVLLHFKQSMPEAPEVMYLMYAIGSSPEVGYHKTRKCFEITEFPICPTEEPSMPSSGSETVSVEAESSAQRIAILGAMLASALAMLLW